MKTRTQVGLPVKLAAGALATGALTALILAGRRPESQWFGRTLVAGSDPNQMAFTFDDGPNGQSTPPLLDVLARHGAHATFFFVGKFVGSRAELVRATHAAGHLIGNHTVSHPFLAGKSEAFVRNELRGCNEALEDVLGTSIRYFRPPYGARSPSVLRVARELGLVPVQWNVQGNDWETIGVDGIVHKVNRGLARARRRGRGANILLHDGFDEVSDYDRSDTVHATDQLLTTARQEGRHIVTVDAWG